MTTNYFLDFSNFLCKFFGDNVIYFVKINYIPGFALCSKKRYIQRDIRKEQKISFSAFKSANTLLLLSEICETKS